MKKVIFISVALLVLPVITFAATGSPEDAANAGLALAKGLAKMGAGIGAGLAGIGAGIGLAGIGGKAMDAIARQPDSISDIRSNMIVAAALVEGVAFFAIVVCLLIVFL